MLKKIALCLILFLSARMVHAYETAESLSYPFSAGTAEQYNSFGLAQGFGTWNKSRGSYHLGHDVGASSGTKVYAAADGTVIESSGHPHGGYGDACGAI